MTSTLKPLNKLAAEILTDWRQHPSNGVYRRYAMPYVEAMLHMKDCESRYGLEYGDMIVARALNNIQQWRGDKAREIKLALNQHLKEYNVRHNGS